MNHPLNLLVYGVPKIGKTSFAALTPDVLVVDTEKSSAHITGLNRLEINSMKDFDAVMARVKKDDVKVLVLDTLDELVNNYVKSEARAKGYARNDGQLTQEGWGVMRERFLTLCRQLRDSNVDLCVVAHAELEDIPEGGKKYTMKLPSDYAREVMGMMDAIGFLGWHVKPDGSKERRLHLTADRLWNAGCRSDLDLKTGEFIPILPEFMDRTSHGTVSFGKVLELWRAHYADGKKGAQEQCEGCRKNGEHGDATEEIDGKRLCAKHLEVYKAWKSNQTAPAA